MLWGILPIHWKIWFSYNIEILRALGFKSSYAFFKRPLVSKLIANVIMQKVADVCRYRTVHVKLDGELRTQFIVPVDFVHIPQGYFTGNGTVVNIVWKPRVFMTSTLSLLVTPEVVTMNQWRQSRHHDNYRISVYAVYQCLAAKITDYYKRCYIYLSLVCGSRIAHALAMNDSCLKVQLSAPTQVMAI